MQNEIFQKAKHFSAKNILFLVTFALILFFGAVVRTIAWQNCLPLFYDEASLIYNMMEKPTAELFLPLFEGQCCPPLFIISSKIFYLIFGANEIAMRFLPWLFSILSLFLFGFLSFKLFKNKLCILAANALFSTSEYIILYTMFFKHYMSDVFFSILIVTLALLLKDKKFSKAKIVVLSAVSIFFILFSYTAAFVINAVFLTYLISRIYAAKKAAEPICGILKKALLYILPIIIFEITYFRANCLGSISDPFVQEYWCWMFGTMFPQNFTQVKNFFIFFGSTTINVYVAMILFFGSIIILFKKDRFLCGIIFFTYVLAMITGLLHLYPFFAERISMYLIPLFIIAIIKPIDYINFKSKTLTTTAIAVCFLLLPNYSKIYKFFENNPNPTLLEVIKHNYDKRYLTEKSVYAKEFIDFLKHSDFSKEDYLFCKYANNMLFEVYDKEQLVDTKKVCYFIKDFPKVKVGSTLFFCLSETHDNIYPEVKNWLDKHCVILYEIPSNDYKFIKTKRVK